MLPKYPKKKPKKYGEEIRKTKERGHWEKP